MKYPVSKLVYLLYRTYKIDSIAVPNVEIYSSELNKTLIVTEITFPQDYYAYGSARLSGLIDWNESTCKAISGESFNIKTQDYGEKRKDLAFILNNRDVIKIFLSV